MSTLHPYYRKKFPNPKREDMFVGDGTHVDFSNPGVHIAAFGEAEPVAKASAQFDDRAAAVIRSAAGPEDDTFWESPHDVGTLLEKGLLNLKAYFGSLVLSPTRKALAVLAYPDFFVGSGKVGREVVSETLLAANSGWCGSFGPGTDSTIDFIFGNNTEGNYDFDQMHLLPMAYRFYDDLRPEAQEHLINVLLAGGRIHGPGQDDTLTQGPYPEYWTRAGMISPLGAKRSIGETENHILMIMTARYLTNQLLYQRNPKPEFDNRRNSRREVLYATLGPAAYARLVGDEPVALHAEPSLGSCAFLLLDLLQRILRDDFSEYNAKNYQTETRWALLNLCSYAYDHEVRLAARMVLDYLSAHFAVSSNDLRRLLPFRRRNEKLNSAHDAQGFMSAGLLVSGDGSDASGSTFALVAGNLRIYESSAWSIWDDPGGNQVTEALGDYRIPPSIHDLFVNDLHRRFHQRLHRTVRSNNVDYGGNRNCDNMEIFAGSPSYLITAGGTPATYAIDPYFLGVKWGHAETQLGVAVTTTFMPTTYAAHKALKADELIQFSGFSDLYMNFFGQTEIGAWNYGVAPDFACGHQLKLPAWIDALKGSALYVSDGHFTFVDQGPVAFANLSHGRPGFFLAIYQEDGLAFLEAYDTWLHPEMSFADFQIDVKNRNLSRHLENNVEAHYQTTNGNQFDFVIWNLRDRHQAFVGAEVLNLVYGTVDLRDAFGNAGEVTSRLLNGTVMNSPRECVVEITNHDLRTQLTLDLGDGLHPRRTSETGEVEQAGYHNEVWVDFEWKGPSHGDAYQPFTTLAAATAAVAEGGVIKIIPGQTLDRSAIAGKRMTIVAPLGGVRIGVRQ